MGYLVIVTVLGWTRCSLDQVFIIIIEGCCWGILFHLSSTATLHSCDTTIEH